MGIQPWFLVLLALTAVTSNAKILTGKEYKANCPRHAEPGAEYRDQCCEYATIYFAQFWANGGHYLTTYLYKMQNWNCTEFTNECKSQTYNFNEFTSIIYKQFCERSAFEKTCSETIKRVIQQESKNLTTEWRQLVEELNPSELELDTLTTPCVGAALFDKYGVGKYFELVQTHTPFCDIVWLGMDTQSALDHELSPWKLSKSCQGSLIFGMAFMIFMGLIIVLSNATIILIFIRRPKMRNSQFYYKVSIAIADFLVGAIVFPTLVVNQYRSFILPRGPGRVFNASEQGLNTTDVLRFDGGGFSTVFNQPYLNFVGCFTTISLFVSVYTLMTASFDRFYAIFRPLQYHRSDKTKQAKYFCVSLWVLALIICTFPFYYYQMRYGLIAAIMVTTNGMNGLIFLCVAFVLPLILVWILTVMTFTTSLKHAKHRGRISVHRKSTKKDKSSIEFRLARTLALMVGIFSACVVPTIIVLVVPFLVNNVTYSLPKQLSLRAANTLTAVQYCIVILLLSNSLWNFFIYSGRDKLFRVAVKEETKRMLYKLRCISDYSRRMSHTSTTRKTQLHTEQTSTGGKSVVSVSDHSLPMTACKNSIVTH